MSEPTRPRRVDVVPFPPSRQAVAQAMRVGRRQAPMHGLFDVDVTEARRRLAQAQPPESLTAFIVAAVARAAAAHPEVHAYRNWRGRLVLHRHVDVATLVEVPTEEGPFPLAHLIRDADIRDVTDIGAEIRGVKADPSSSPSGRLLARVAPIAGRIPGLVRLFYWWAARSVRARRIGGTVSVTSVGMFAGGGGFGIGFPTVLTLTVVIGGLSQRPRVREGQVEIRDILDLTVTLDHNVVDGAPAARFGAELRRLIESAEILD